MIDDDWLRALGRSVLYFSFVETAVVSIVNTLDPSIPSYMEKALEGKKTAGQVKDDLKKSIAILPEGPLRSELEQLAIRFAAAKEPAERSAPRDARFFWRGHASRPVDPGQVRGLVNTGAPQGSGRIRKAGGRPRRGALANRAFLVPVQGHFPATSLALFET